jgi:uncharacterized membrane protein YhaH (DUF805 family)
VFKLFLEAITKKYFHFRGRASRKEYISFVIFNTLTSLLINTLFFLTYNGGIVASFSYLIFSFLPAITVTVRRLHDMNLNGFWNCLIIPILIMCNLDRYLNIGLIVGFIGAICIFSVKGTPTTNKYGKPPIN